MAALRPLAVLAVALAIAQVCSATCCSRGLSGYNYLSPVNTLTASSPDLFLSGGCGNYGSCGLGFNGYNSYGSSCGFPYNYGSFCGSSFPFNSYFGSGSCGCGSFGSGSCGCGSYGSGSYGFGNCGFGNSFPYYGTGCGSCRTPKCKCACTA